MANSHGGLNEEGGVKVQRGFLGLVAIGGEAREQVDQEVVGTAVAGVLDLADILELINDRLDERAFAQEQPVGERQELLRMFLRSLVMRRSPCARKSCSASGAEI